MPLSHDPARTHRILYEIIVDCYDEEEELMGWYYYLSDNLAFPISATVRLPLPGGKSEEKSVQILEIDPKSENGKPLRLGIVEKGKDRLQFICPSDIVRIDSAPENLELLNDWLYGHNFEMLSEPPPPNPLR